jgi:methylated-DNA-[protein]-cysteine S-methyltransferase
MLLAAANGQLVGVWFEGQRHQPDLSLWPVRPEEPVLQETRRQLAGYFAGTRTTFDLPLYLSSGTEFQQAVWRCLLTVTQGSTCSYSQLSALVGRPSAVRAAAGAVARNPLSVVVPCHRVLGSNGAMTGYAGGLTRKAALLTLESKT